MMFSVLLCSGDREVELAAVEGAAYNHKLCLTIVFDKIYNLKSIFLILSFLSLLVRGFGGPLHLERERQVCFPSPAQRMV